MGIVALTQSSTNNLVIAQPTYLPINVTDGVFSLSLSFEGEPSASLEYRHIPASEINRYEAAYPIGKKITLYKNDLKVATFGYTREAFNYQYSRYDTYTVQVSFDYAHTKALETPIKVKDMADARGDVPIYRIASRARVDYTGPSFKFKLPQDADINFTLTLKSVVESYARILGCFVEYGAGISLVKLENSRANLRYPETQLVTDGQNIIATPAAYNDTLLTGGFQNTDEKEKEIEAPPKVNIIPKAPVIETTEEFDDKYAAPPPGSKVLKGLESTFDMSPPQSKVKKIIVTIDGTPDSEQTEIYNFMFTAADIINSRKDLLSTNPAKYWQKIEQSQTKYIYKKISPVTLGILATDPSDKSRKIPLFVHPDYAQIVSMSLAGAVTFPSNAEYLTEINTTGWKYARFTQETLSDLQTIDSKHPFHAACKYFKLPTEERTLNKLISTRALYKDEVAPPFSVEWVLVKELPQRIRQYIDSVSQVTKDGRVGVLKPDLNYVEPMSVLIETSRKNSFSYTRHPENQPDNPQPPLITGEESFQDVRRTITAPNKYREKTSVNSSGEAGFNTSTMQTNYKDAIGRIPEAQARKKNYEERADTSSAQKFQQSFKETYIINSDYSDFSIPGTSENFAEAQTLGEALLGTKTKLQIADIQNNTRSLAIFGFHPGIKIGDVVSTDKNMFENKGRWVVKSMSFSIDFAGKGDKILPLIIATCDATQVSLGLLRERRVNHELKKEPLKNDPTTGKDPEIETNSSSDTAELGGILFNSPQRRAF